MIIIAKEVINEKLKMKKLQIIHKKTESGYHTGNVMWITSKNLKQVGDFFHNKKKGRDLNHINEFTIQN